MTKKTSSNTKKKTVGVKKKEQFVPTASHERVTHNNDAVLNRRVDLLPDDLIKNTMDALKSLMDGFKNISNNNLTDTQSHRKIGAGIKNYGFIEKTAELIKANPRYAQFFEPVDLINCIRNFDKCCDVSIILQAFDRSVTNSALVYSTGAYTMSLIAYNTLKELSRRGDSAAVELFRELQPFFKKTKRDPTKLTEKKLEKEARALLRGKKDGRIIVENIKPKLTGGKRKIIDEAFTDTEEFLETKQDEKRK
jgi:hypothetical protein